MKKFVIGISAVSFAYLVFLYSTKDQLFCKTLVFNNCTEITNNLLEMFLVLVPIAVVIIISYWCSLKSLKFLIHFSIIWLFASLLIIRSTPAYGGVGIVSIDRGAVSFLLSVLYFFVSIIVIAYKSWRLRGKSL